MSLAYQNSSRMKSGSNYYHHPYFDTNSMMYNTGPSTYPMPMPPQYKDHSVVHSNSLKNNRVAPQQFEFNPHYQQHTSFRTASVIQPTKTFHPAPSHIYSMNQSTKDTTYPYRSNQSYLPKNHYMDDTHSDNDLREKDNQTSCFSKPLCYGLTRLTGGILFGSMLILGVGSVGGLLASIILYAEDSNTNSQWKVLGIIVSTVMLVTVLMTFAVFMYCYKKGRINSDENTKNAFEPEYIQDNEFGKINNYAASTYTSPVPYEMFPNTSSTSASDDIIHVEDKQTNTQISMAGLRVNDIKRGVWPARNAYGGISNRSPISAKMASHYAQTTSDTTDHSIASMNMFGSSENHYHHDTEQNTGRFLAPKQHHTLFENTVDMPKGRPPVEEYLEFAELSKHNDKKKSKERKIQRYKNVSIKRVKPVEESADV